MKRRVLLAGLGTASIGIGAAFGSGAFTSIEADRDVELNVDSDETAQIIFREGSGIGADRLLSIDESNTVDVIEFSQTNLNEQSKTTFEKALEVENNTDETGSTSADEGLTVDLYVQERDDGGIDDGDDDVLDFRVEDGDNGTRSIVEDDSEKNEVRLPDSDGNDIAEIDIVVDLRDDGVTTSDQNSDNNDLEEIEQVTFVVEAVDNR